MERGVLVGHSTFLPLHLLHFDTSTIPNMILAQITTHFFFFFFPTLRCRMDCITWLKLPFPNFFRGGPWMSFNGDVGLEFFMYIYLCISHTVVHLSLCVGIYITLLFFVLLCCAVLGVSDLFCHFSPLHFLPNHLLAWMIRCYRRVCMDWVVWVMGWDGMVGTGLHRDDYRVIVTIQYNKIHIFHTCISVSGRG